MLTSVERRKGVASKSTWSTSSPFETSSCKLNFPWIPINRFGTSPLFYVAYVELVFHVRAHLTAVTQRGIVIHGLMLDTVQNQRSQTCNSQPKKEQKKQRTKKIPRAGFEPATLTSVTERPANCATATTDEPGRWSVTSTRHAQNFGFTPPPLPLKSSRSRHAIFF